MEVPFATAVPTAPQLTPENLRELQVARLAMRKVRRAASVASFDGWTIGAFGALTFLTGLPDLSSVALGLGMVVVAFVEVRGAGRLRRLDASATRSLAWNQVVLGTLLFTYAAWRIVTVMRGGVGGEYEAIVSLDPQIGQMLQRLMTLVYAALIAIAVFGQGGMALYYHTRRRHVESYLAQTPPWIVAMQRAGVAV